MITFNRPVYAEAVFLIADKVNTNNRIYTTDAIEFALGQYIKDYVNENRAVGYIDHSNQNLNHLTIHYAAFKIIDIFWKENKATCVIKILNTVTGEILKGLLKDGVNVGLSLCGKNIKEMNGKLT